MQHQVVQPPAGHARVGRAVQAYRDACAKQREMLAEIHHLDHPEVWKRDGYADMTTWVSGHFGITYFVAERWVTAAHALERLPLLAEAFAAGRISLEKTLELARFATGDTEAGLIKWAEKVCPRTIRARGEREGKEAAPARDADESRRVTWNWSMERDRLELFGVFPPEQGTQIVNAIKGAASEVPELPEEERPEWCDDDDLAAARYADALWLLCCGEALPVPEVVVHAPVGLVAGEGPYLEGAVPFHEEVARRLACDCRLRFVLTNEEGDALGVGRRDRNPPRWLERQVRHRDRHQCTFPGCPHRRYLVSHHVRHWIKDRGPTEYWNLVTVCPFHHKLVHEYGWSVTLSPEEGVRWYRPDGSRFDPRARLRGPP